MQSHISNKDRDRLYCLCRPIFSLLFGLLVLLEWLKILMMVRWVNYAFLIAHIAIVVATERKLVFSVLAHDFLFVFGLRVFIFAEHRDSNTIHAVNLIVRLFLR